MNNNDTIILFLKIKLDQQQKCIVILPNPPLKIHGYGPASYYAT